MTLTAARTEYLSWLATTRNRSPNTLRAYGSDLDALERFLRSGVRVDEIDSAALLAFFASQRDTGLKSSSLKRRAAAIRGFCRWLVMSERIPSDPAAGLAISAGHSRQLPRTVRAINLRALLRTLEAEAFDARTAPQPTDVHAFVTLVAVALMVSTGVRANEVVSLRRDDIDSKSHRVRVLGKGRRERFVYLPNAWLTDRVATLLTEHLSLGVAHQRLLFNRDLAPLSPAALRARVAKAAERAGIHQTITPHMFRHSAATSLLEAGVDIRIIQRLLGHASLSTTEIYTHVSDQTLKRSLERADVLGTFI